MNRLNQPHIRLTVCAMLFGFDMALAALSALSTQWAMAAIMAFMAAIMVQVGAEAFQEVDKGFRQ